MKVGDEVIIDPYTDIGTKEAGIYRIEKVISSNVFLLNNGLQHSKDCLILADPFEVGDVVTIRQNINKKIFPHGLATGMDNFLGKEVTISGKYLEKYYSNALGSGKYYYTIKEDTYNYGWPLCAFSKIIKKSSKNESRLQKQDSSFDRGSRECGIRVRSRKHRARVEISSLKHQKIIGRG
jgi:hypothetical protein